MENISIKAIARSEKPKKVRDAGFIPGVLNGPGTTSIPVKFDSIALNKIIARHGSNAKLWVALGDEKKFGFIKEVQRHPVEGKVIHISIQLVSKDQNVKMQLPIAFHGQNGLESRLLQLQIYKAEIEVEGKPAFMPDEVIVDVAKKEVGDNITVKDFPLSHEIKVVDPENEIYAVSKAAKAEAVEEAEEVKPEE